MPVQLAAMLQARGPIAMRARYLVGNNALATSGAEAWVGQLVGTGLKPQSQHPDPEIRARLNEAWEAWTDEADFDGLTDHYGQQGIAVRRMVIDGDAFASFSYGGRGRVPFQVRLIDAEQVVSTLTQPTDNGSLIVNGVEVDALGRRTAVHLYRDTPGLPFGAPAAWCRIPASDVLQLLNPVVPGQVRGLSWFAPVLLRLNELDQAHDAQLMRQKIAAMLAGFIKTMDGATSFEGDGKEPVGGILDGGLEPGTLKVLAPGQDITFSAPASIGPEAIDFLKITAREIAVGLGLPSVVLTGDLESLNLSSIRHGLLSWHRRSEAIQHGVVAFQFVRPIWRRFVTAAVLSGAIDGRGFERSPEAFFRVNFIPPRNTLADPLKDTQADALAIRERLMSRRQAVAARGYDLEALDREIAEDERRSPTRSLPGASQRPAPPVPENARS